MTAEVLTSIRELDARLSDGIQVRLLWSGHDQRVWVAVLDTRTGDAFCIGVREDERALDVFRHPYAYAAEHGIVTAGALMPFLARDPMAA